MASAELNLKIKDVLKMLNLKGYCFDLRYPDGKRGKNCGKSSYVYSQSDG